MEVIAEAAIVTEVTTGVPDNDIVSLMIGDRPSIPFSLASLNLTAATKVTSLQNRRIFHHEYSVEIGVSNPKDD